MKRANNIFKNTGAVLVGTLIRMASSFVLTVLVARRLGSEGMGEFSLLLSLLYVFETIATLGLQPLVVREVAKNRDSAVAFLINTGLLSVLSSVLMFFVLVGFTHIAGYTETIRVSALYIGGALFFSTLNSLFQGLFIAYERAEFTFYATIAESVFKLVAGIVILTRGYGIVMLSVVIAFSSFAGFLTNVILQSVCFERIRFAFDWNLCRWIIRNAPTFAGISVFNALLSHAVLIILSMMAEMEVVGYYGAAMRLVGVFRLILQSYKAALQPVSARLVQRSMARLERFCHSSIRYILVLILPLCVGTTILSGRIVVSLFSESLIEAGPVLRIVIWVLLPYGIGMVLSNVLIASDHQKVNLHVNAVSMIVRVMFALALIPVMGAQGAGLSILVSRLVFFVMQTHFIRKHMFPLHIDPELWKILAASIFMGVGVFLLRELGLIWSIGSGVILFFLFLMGSGGFHISELRKFMFSTHRAASESP